MSEPIRILQVVGEMSPGGIETLIMNIYRNIDRDKVQFDFLFHSESCEGSYVPEIERLGGRIYRAPIIRTLTETYYWKLFEYISFLKHFFAEHNEFRVIHGHMTNTASIYMPIAKKYGNVSCFIAHSHQSQATPGLSGFVTNILQKPLKNIATEYFACSDLAAEWLFPRKYVNEGKVHIIKNGVDSRFFKFDVQKRQRIREELGIKNEFVVGNVSRFKKVKNHCFQLEVFSEIKKLHNNSVLLLVGDGELREEIENKISELGLDNSVRLLGIRSDVYDLMQAFDLFLLPSINEGLPVVGIEAQAAGLPLVTSTGVTKETDITGNVTFLDLELGATVWAEKIIEIANAYQRHDMYDYIRINGYDITETAAWLQDFYINKHDGE